MTEVQVLLKKAVPNHTADGCTIAWRPELDFPKLIDFEELSCTRFSTQTI